VAVRSSFDDEDNRPLALTLALLCASVPARGVCRRPSFEPTSVGQQSARRNPASRQKSLDRPVERHVRHTRGDTSYF